MTDLIEMLKRHEGTGPVLHGRMLPYRDSVSKLTIGWGRNLDDRGISQDEATLLLENDVQETITALRHSYAWFILLLPARQDAVTDMAFNLGMTKFANFHHTIDALAAGKYDEAAQLMLLSKWAQQVGQRAIDLASMVRTGQYL